MTAQISKSAAVNKNFVYYSIQNQAVLDREPLKTSWDLTFTQYTTFLPIAYTVTGVLQNNNVRIAEVRQVNDPATYISWENHSLKTAINELGYDWKTYDFGSNSYLIEDSLVYFVKTAAGDIWKVIPTGFGGSTDGNFIFTKEKLVITSIREENDLPGNSLAVYPNPSNGENINIIYNIEKEAQAATLKIIDLSGRLVHAAVLNRHSGLYTQNLSVNGFNPGMYIIHLEVNGKGTQQKLIIHN